MSDFIKHTETGQKSPSLQRTAGITASPQGRPINTGGADPGEVQRMLQRVY